MTNFYESYVARLGFKLSIPGLRSDDNSDMVPAALLGLLTFGYIDTPRNINMAAPVYIKYFDPDP